MRDRFRKRPKVLSDIQRQSGYVKNVLVDKLLIALPPGKRISKSGNVYWETRKNRSDLDKKRRI